jgi:hypothetical protein
MTNAVLSTVPSPAPDREEVRQAWMTYMSLMSGYVVSLYCCAGREAADVLIAGDTTVQVMSIDKVAEFYRTERNDPGTSLLMAQIVNQYSGDPAEQHAGFWRFYHVGESMLSERGSSLWIAIQYSTKHRHKAIKLSMTPKDIIDGSLEAMKLSAVLSLAPDLSRLLQKALEDSANANGFLAAVRRTFVGDLTPEKLISKIPSLKEWPMTARTNFFGVMADMVGEETSRTVVMTSMAEADKLQKLA